MSKNCWWQNLARGLCARSTSIVFCHPYTSRRVELCGISYWVTIYLLIFTRAWCLFTWKHVIFLNNIFEWRARTVYINTGSFLPFFTILSFPLERYIFVKDSINCNLRTWISSPILLSSPVLYFLWFLVSSLSIFGTEQVLCAQTSMDTSK